VSDINCEDLGNTTLTVTESLLQQP